MVHDANQAADDFPHPDFQPSSLPPAQIEQTPPMNWAGFDESDPWQYRQIAPYANSAYVLQILLRMMASGNEEWVPPKPLDQE
jgi:hypothetical protein